MGLCSCRTRCNRDSVYKCLWNRNEYGTWNRMFSLPIIYRITSLRNEHSYKDRHLHGTKPSIHSHNQMPPARALWGLEWDGLIILSTGWFHEHLFLNENWTLLMYQPCHNIDKYILTVDCKQKPIVFSPFIYIYYYYYSLIHYILTSFSSLHSSLFPRSTPPRFPLRKEQTFQRDQSNTAYQVTVKLGTTPHIKAG